MKLSTKGQYAVIAIIDLMHHCKNDEPVSLSSISIRQQLPLQYLEQLFSKLRRNGIVESVRGSSGGYLLSRPHDEITLIDIMNAVDEPIKTMRCEGKKEGCMGLNERCLTHKLWQGLGEHIQQYLSKITLADVNASNFKTERKI